MGKVRDGGISVDHMIQTQLASQRVFMHFLLPLRIDWRFGVPIDGSREDAGTVRQRRNRVDMNLLASSEALPAGILCLDRDRDSSDT